MLQIGTFTMSILNQTLNGGFTVLKRFSVRQFFKHWGPFTKVERRECLSAFVSSVGCE